MKTYIKTFKNITEYTAWKNSANFVEPSAAYIEDTGEVITSGTHDYSRDYLTITSLEASNTISWKTSSSSLIKTISVSVDNGDTWTSVASTTSGATLGVLGVGEEMLVKGTNTALGSNTANNFFVSTGDFNVSGNVMSLLEGDDFIGKTDLTGKDYALSGLFNLCTGLINAKNLILPATILALSCYGSMFVGCTSLVEAPVLPAALLEQDCYNSMFCDCTSLNKITCFATDISADDCTTDWTNGVAGSGTFIKAAGMEDWPTGQNGIPSGWTVISQIKGRYPGDYVRGSGVKNIMVLTQAEFNDLQEYDDNTEYNII